MALPDHILHRLLLAKGFLADAARIAGTSRNDIEVSRLVVSLHDAVDNLLGAIATNRAVHLSHKDGMIEAYSKLERAGCQLGDRAQLDQLNTMRNAIKHQGVPQSIPAALSLLAVISQFCERNSEEEFDVPLSHLHRIDQVADRRRREELEKAKALIDAGSFKEALEAMAVIFFNTHQSMSVTIGKWLQMFGGEIQPPDRPIWPKRDVSADKLECVSLGIDPDELTRFLWLTPRVGTLEEEIVFEKNGYFWHEKNWTESNARSCLDFLTSFALAKERSVSGSSIISRQYKLNEITFLKDAPLREMAGSKAVAKFMKGETCTAWLPAFVEGSWQDYGETWSVVRIFKGDEAYDGKIEKSAVSVGADFGEKFV